MIKSFTLAFTFLFIVEIQSCLFKYDWHSKIEEKAEPSTTKTFSRKTSKDFPCICGETDQDQRWIVYIRVNISPAKIRICPGTIINSNMVLTSVRCLEKPGKKMRIFDAWKISGESLFLEKDISLIKSPELNPIQLISKDLIIKKVIFPQQFGYDNSYGIKASESDVAIIVVKNFNFLSKMARNELKLWPVCLPMLNNITNEQLFNRKAHYAGVRGWEDNRIKYPIEVGHNSFILPAESCNEYGKLNISSGKHTLCTRFAEFGPTTEGGPLTLRSRRYIEGGPDRSFLVGIATWVEKEKQNAKLNYAYFSNVNSIIPHIEREASNHGSVWCKEPSYFDDYWPWETFKKEQDQSLDCECGKKPGQGAQSRVINGEDAVMFEFPWMVKLAMYTGEGGYPGICGGSIINDRVILTAAHCVVKMDEIGKISGFNLDPSGEKPELHEVHLRAHYDNVQVEPKPIRVFAMKTFFHPGFPIQKIEGGNVEFDVAVLILNDSLASYFNEKDENGDPLLVPICLPQKGHLEDVIKRKLSATISGWGLSVTKPELQKKIAAGDGSGLFKPNLQKLTVPVHDIFKCTEIDEKFGVGELSFASDTRICAGNFNHLKDVYQGDSGGPLVVDSEPFKFTQIGVVSYTFIHNDTQNKALVASTYYTSVEAFLPFIHYYSHRYGGKACKR